MRRSRRRAWLALAGLTLATAACSRADLDAITRAAGDRRRRRHRDRP